MSNQNATAMNRIKLGWARLTVLGKVLKARFVVQTMSENADVYVTPNPPLPEIEAKAGEVNQAEIAKENGGTDRTRTRNLRLAELTTMMNQLVDYVQVVSKGDEELVAKAGLEVRKDPSKWPVPDKVQKLEVMPGGNPGSILLTWSSVKYKRMYIIEMYIDAPAETLANGAGQSTEAAVGTEGHWVKIESLSKPRYTVTGLVSGQRYRFRVYARNSNGQGDYSDEISSVAR